MSTTDMDAMYSCNICNRIFQLHSMYACYHGHYLCRKCYKQVYYKGKEKRCPHGTCNAYIISTGDVNKGEPMERSKLMFPNPCIYSQNSSFPTDQSLMSIASLYRPSILAIASSKKPVHCPYHACNKTIAVSSLDSHFEHEHKHVAAIITNLETRNGLEFYFRDLHGKIKTLCLVLINIEGCNGSSVDDVDTRPVEIASDMDEESYCKPQTSFTKSLQPIGSSTKPFFIVMAAKVTANDYNGFEDEEEEDILDAGFSPIDRIIFYVTSNITTNYSYTIAVSTPDQSVRVKYYGPLLTMNEDYKKLCEDGKGLIITHNHVDGMSDYGSKAVLIDVIIHERAEDTYDDDF